MGGITIVVSAREAFFVDLFAGSGGLSLGLEQAGFHPVFVNELNNDAMETYLVNRDHQYPLLRQKYRVSDVKDMVLDRDFIPGLIESIRRDYGISIDRGELDLVVGGPPCQGYSGIGHRRSYSVDRKQLPSNHLYQDMVYVVSYLRPKIFLFENVQGLLSARWTRNGGKGEVWEDVKGTFAGIEGYTTRHALVYAKDYGVPQNRPRVLLVGARDDLGIVPDDGRPAGGYVPMPSGEYPNLEDLWSDLIDPDYKPGGSTDRYPYKAMTEVQRMLRFDPRTGKVKRKGSKLTEHEYSRHSARVVERFQAMLNNGGTIPPSMKTKKFAQRLLHPKWGPEGPNITATSLPDDYVHYCQPRILTVREWARLQMFPDWYEFAGKRTTGGLRRAGNPQKGNFERELPKYTQIGNAVPVSLAEALGHHFQALLDTQC